MKDKKVKAAKKIKESAKPVENKKINKRTIENHRKAAAHHIEAAKHHLEAVKQYEAGNSEKAAHSALLAHGHHAIAGEFLTDDAKHHAQEKKQTNYHH